MHALLRWGLCACLCVSLTACASRKTSSPEKDVQAQRVISTAYTQVGKRYRLGGDSPHKGFDCSGLVWWAYQQHGIAVPRITKDQASAGTRVVRDKPEPGDILVFRTRTGPNGLHTGIYKGNGAFIHSPRKGQRVREEQLEADHWQDKLIAVRRVL